MDEQVNPLERDHCVSVVLPGGLEKSATVHGSKPVMDLLVTLCASYHLNPSDYTVEILSANKNNISFKPNSPIGSLEAEKIVLKPKGVEEKIRRPYMPEASVRLLINYNKSHKAVVRVSPRVPLEMLLPVMCDKCEFKVETTVLLRDSHSKEVLDLTKTLNEHGLREVFAKDTAAREPVEQAPEADAISPPPLQDLPKREKKEKENSGFLSLFRRRKKKPATERPLSPSALPGLNNQVGVGMNGQDVSSSNSARADMPKKRHAPQPPMAASQSVPNNLSTCHLRGARRSAETTLRSTKRKAPPPPGANTQQELQVDTEVKGSVDSLNPVEEQRESDESDSANFPSLSSPSSPQPCSSSSSFRPSLSHLHDLANPYLPSFRGKDLSDARCALAKVLTSSVSRGALVKRLRNSAPFPKLHNGSSLTPVTQRGSDNVFSATEQEPVLTSNLPSEPEWEDPIQRKGMTTFKVVPSKKTHDPEVTLGVSDQIIVEDNPESDVSPELKTETEEDPSSRDRSETETASPSPESASQEIKAPDSPASAPPLLDLDAQDCPGSPLSEVRDMEQKVEDEPEITSEVIPAPASDCSDGELPSDVWMTSEDQSEALQSPSRQAVNAGHCGSYTYEREVEEDVVQEKEGQEEEEEEDSFPPPPPPVFYDEDIEVREDTAASSDPPSPTSNEPTVPFSEEHKHEPASSTPDTSAAAPKPQDKMSAAPSRFAQAVALAVQRSRLLNSGRGPQAPSSPLSSPPRSMYQFGA